MCDDLLYLLDHGVPCPCRDHTGVLIDVEEVEDMAEVPKDVQKELEEMDRRIAEAERKAAEKAAKEAEKDD